MLYEAVKRQAQQIRHHLW